MEYIMHTIIQYIIVYEYYLLLKMKMTGNKMPDQIRVNSPPSNVLETLREP